MMMMNKIKSEIETHKIKHKARKAKVQATTTNSVQKKGAQKRRKKKTEENKQSETNERLVTENQQQINSKCVREDAR